MSTYTSHFVVFKVMTPCSLVCDTGVSKGKQAPQMCSIRTISAKKGEGSHQTGNNGNSML